MVGMNTVFFPHIVGSTIGLAMNAALYGRPGIWRRLGLLGAGGVLAWHSALWVIVCTSSGGYEYTRVRHAYRDLLSDARQPPVGFFGLALYLGGLVCIVLALILHGYSIRRSP